MAGKKKQEVTKSEERREEAQCCKERAESNVGYVNAKTAAKYLGVSISTFNKYKPPFVMIGSEVKRYCLADLDNWVHQNGE